MNFKKKILKVSGIISLCDLNDNISQQKRYVNKSSRTQIIDEWRKLYKSKSCIIKIFPDEKEILEKKEKK